MAEPESGPASDPVVTKLRLWLNFAKFVLGTVALGIIATALNYQIQDKELKLKEKDLQQQYLKNFIDQALDADLEKRVRFSHYFAVLLKGNWSEYHKQLNAELVAKQQLLHDKEKQLALATRPSKGGVAAPSVEAEVLKREVLTLTRDLKVRGPRDFEQMFPEVRTNELELSRLGEEAFDNRDYAWAIKFLEQARTVSSSGVWQSSFPYLIGSYLILGQPTKATTSLDEMFRRIDEPFGYLTNATTLGFLVNNFGKVRKVLGPEHQKLVDTTIDRVIEKKKGRT